MATDITDIVTKAKMIQRQRHIAVLSEVVVELYQNATTEKQLDKAKELQMLLNKLMVEEKFKAYDKIYNKTKEN